MNELVETPIIKIGDEVLKLEPNSHSIYGHQFGGELNLTVKGFSKSERPLHRLLSLDLSDAHLKSELNGITKVPLLYGFVFDGCSLSYKLIDDETVEILSLEPSQSDSDWPYENYPESFSPLLMQLQTVKGQFEYDLIENVSFQLGLESTDELLILVPPSKRYGVSLWGEMGDAEGVTVVFTINLDSNVVVVQNVCS